MGSGTFTSTSYAAYNTSLGRDYDLDSGRVFAHSLEQVYTSRKLDESLDPKGFKVRECVNSDEHPNTIPVILALDVTGSMGGACKETAEALGVIMTDLYKKFKDIEFCVMGIGDLAYDSAPIQMSQYESDIRIAESLDKIYVEHGGGGNSYESYTAAWYMALKRTKLDCIEKHGRKGIIITMGDEPLNPYLPVDKLNHFVNGNEQANVETGVLYEEVSKKFDVYHIAVDDSADSYHYYKDEIKESFGKVLGDHLKVSTINDLSKTIVECVTDSVNGGKTLLTEELPNVNPVNANGEITW